MVSPRAMSPLSLHPKSPLGGGSPLLSVVFTSFGFDPPNFYISRSKGTKSLIVPTRIDCKPNATPDALSSRSWLKSLVLRGSCHLPAGRAGQYPSHFPCMGNQLPMPRPDSPTSVLASNLESKLGNQPGESRLGFLNTMCIQTGRWGTKGACIYLSSKDSLAHTFSYKVRWATGMIWWPQ